MTRDWATRVAVARFSLVTARDLFHQRVIITVQNCRVNVAPAQASGSQCSQTFAIQKSMVPDIFFTRPTVSANCDAIC